MNKCPICFSPRTGRYCDHCGKDCRVHDMMMGMASGRLSLADCRAIAAIDRIGPKRIESVSFSIVAGRRFNWSNFFVGLGWAVVIAVVTWSLMPSRVLREYRIVPIHEIDLWGGAGSVLQSITNQPAPIVYGKSSIAPRT